MGFDRTQLRMHSFDGADKEKAYWASKTPSERLEAAIVMIRIAFGLENNKKYRMEKSLFAMKKRDE